METVEERSAIECDGVSVVAARDGGRELGSIARDESRIEPKLFGSGDRLVCAEVFAQGIERLGQRARTSFVVGIRPEQREDFFAGHSALTGAREKREDRNPTRLRHRACQRISVVSTNGEAAQRLNANHVRIPKTPTTGRGRKSR